MRLFVSYEENKHIISLRKTDEPTTSNVSSALERNEAVNIECSIPNRILTRLKERSYFLEYGGYEDGKLLVKIYLADGLMKLQFGSEGIPSRKINASLQEVMAYFHGFNYPGLCNIPFILIC